MKSSGPDHEISARSRFDNADYLAAFAMNFVKL